MSAHRLRLRPCLFSSSAPASCSFSLSRIGSTAFSPRTAIAASGACCLPSRSLFSFLKKKEKDQPTAAATSQQQQQQQQQPEQQQPPPQHAHRKEQGGAPPANLLRPKIPGVSHIIAVASGKGGVGKSTTAVNLALALRSLPFPSTQALTKVALLDADIYGPSIPRMMNLVGEGSRPKVDPKSNHMIPPINYGVKCMSMGFLVDEDSAMIWRGPMVMSALEQLLRKVDWGEVDVMVVDLPPGTGDAQLTLTQRVPLNGAVIVSTPQDIALLDARRGATMFRQVGVPILGMVENMSYFVSPSGEISYIFGKGGAKKTAAELHMDFLGEVPLDISIREGSDEGKPVVVTAPHSPQAQVYVEIARKVLSKLQQDPAVRSAQAEPKIVFS
ncbi:Iron-sulfur cluster carrier protein [Balamuthia mandrillaris]